MKLIKLPPGRFLAQFEAKKTITAGGLFIPSTARGMAREEVAQIMMKGAAVYRNGGLFDIPIEVGEWAWLHPQYGDQWRAESEGSGEIRSYDFSDYRGTVDKEKSE